MKTTTLFITVLLFVSSLYSHAEKKRLYLFDDYTAGTVLMKNKSRIQSPLNYDAANHVMMFKDKDEDMILTQLEAIDTVFIDNRKFIPTGRSMFLEVLKLDNGILYINWKLEQLAKGKLGAFGQVSQNSVDAYDVDLVRGVSGKKESKGTEVYETLNKSEYWITIHDKPGKFKNKKTLLKLYPGKETTIEAFIKNNKVDMNNPDDIGKLANFCMGLQ